MKLSGVIALVALVVAIIAVYSSTNQAKPVDNTPIFEKKTDEKPEIEIADYMQFLQPFHEKMYWAMQAHNQELTEFYIHELGEKMLEVVKADVWHEGRNLSEDMKTYGMKPLENLKNALGDTKLTEERYVNLTQSCNSCHEQHKVSFINIKKPEQNRFSNQNFSK